LSWPGSFVFLWLYLYRFRLLFQTYKMKKQLPLLILLFFTCTFAWSQGKWIKTTTPCDNELLKKTPGRWMPIGRFTWDKISSLEEQEILKRLETIQKMAFAVYPEPMAYDAMQGFALYKKDFASQLKLEKTAYGINRTAINGIPTILYEYFVKFCEYFCGSDSYQMFRGAGCETGTNLVVTINTLGPLFNPLHLDDFSAEVMRIDGKPVQMLSPIVGKWKGHEVYNSNGIYNPNEKIVLLFHRDGMLPYIPVTRKQYLDRSIQCLQKMLESYIKAYENPEGLTLLMDKKERDAQINKMQKYRDGVLKNYNDEMETTINAGLLDSPAIVNGFLEQSTERKIFTTIEKGGNQLVTENPAYFKKDLPKYIPQIIICLMSYVEKWLGLEANPYRLYEQDFPIQKLQAMIDK
jgi:hypothetical protein